MLDSSYPRDVADLQKQLEKHRRAVDTERIDLTVRELVRMASSRELNSSPVYQRKFRWDEKRESMLIESLYLGLPVPPLYVATNADGTWELVDGVQRVSTLIHYISDDPKALKRIGKESTLVLSELVKLHAFNGMAFKDMPSSLQLHFYKRSLNITALSDKSDRSIRFDLFERLNRGGVSLSSHEVRGCVYRGPFSKFLRKLAKSPHFQSLLKLRQAQKHDGTSEELVLKFFAYLYNRTQFDGAVTEFLNSYMDQADKNFDFAASEGLFSKVCELLHSGIKGPVLRTGTSVTPINQFEAIMVGAGQLLLDEKIPRVPKNKKWLDDETLVKHSTKGTNTRVSLNGRIDRAMELLAP